MAGMRLLSVLLLVETIAAAIAGNFHGLMTGFWVFAGMMVVTALIVAIINYQATVKALDITQMRVAAWAVYLILAGVMANVLTAGYGFPQGGSIAIGLVVASGIWWVYYQIEPVNG